MRMCDDGESRSQGFCTVHYSPVASELDNGGAGGSLVVWERGQCTVMVARLSWLALARLSRGGRESLSTLSKSGLIMNVNHGWRECNVQSAVAITIRIAATDVRKQDTTSSYPWLVPLSRVLDRHRKPPPTPCHMIRIQIYTSDSLDYAVNQDWSRLVKIFS